MVVKDIRVYFPCRHHPIAPLTPTAALGVKGVGVRRRSIPNVRQFCLSWGDGGPAPSPSERRLLWQSHWSVKGLRCIVKRSLRDIKWI